MTTNRFSLIFVIPFLCVMTLVSKSYAADGKALYQSCVACHGEDGQGNPSLNAPSLAGQFDWYLTRQLNHFKQGVRGSNEQDKFGQQMQVFAMQLTTDADVNAVAKYIESMPSTKQNAQLSGDLMNGSRYYQAKCGACHGGKGEGNAAFNAPKLAQQNIEYLQRQMAHFKDGVRGSHANDKFGKQMAMMSKVVSEKELHDILFYIAQQ